jgi:hypothetical protein
VATKNRAFPKNTLASRIHRRMLALGFESVKDLERQCGFVSKKTGKTTNMISDLLEGAKDGIGPASLAVVARVLQTNVAWLIDGTGNEAAVTPNANHTIDMISGVMRNINYGSIISVEKSFRARISILRLDQKTGECAFHFHDDLAMTVRRGLIIDPAIYVKDNVYIECLNNRSEISVIVKTGKIEGAPDTAFIIDSRS